MTKRGLIGVILATLLLGCAQAPTAREAERGAGEATRPVTVKRISAGILGDAPALVRALTGFGQRGTDVLEELVLAGMTSENNQGVLLPALAASVPSVDNGLWQVFPDGRMQTTWKLRPGVRWHDGTPLTSADLAFAARIGMEVPEFGDVAYGFIERIETPDPTTVTVYWKQPYVEADRMFGARQYATALPRHLLERPYTENRAGFTQLPYWSEEFVGSGAFKLRQFMAGSHVVLEAFDDYVLGRPKLDVLEVRFFSEPTAMMGSILGGGIDVTLGKALSIEQAIEIRDQWRDGRMENAPSNAISVYPQFINPNPPIVTNVQFRRAMLHAIDRQELADTLLFGYGTVAHSFMFPNQAQYREIEARLPRYDHDPRRAAQLLEGLGYAKGTDGFYRDAAGQPLSVEFRSSTSDANQKAMFTITDGWQRLGVKVEPIVYSRQAGQNNEYLFTFPAFYIQRYTSDLAGLKNLHGSRAPLPENNFRSGNTARYVNPELDGLLDRFFVTIPQTERLQLLGQILSHIADQLPQLSLFFDAEPTVMHNRLLNVYPRWPSSTQAWNAHEWDVKPWGARREG